MTPQDIILIGCPVDSGKRSRGCLMGPDAYRTAGLAEAHDGPGTSRDRHGQPRARPGHRARRRARPSARADRDHRLDAEHLGRRAGRHGARPADFHGGRSQPVAGQRGRCGQLMPRHRAVRNSFSGSMPTATITHRKAAVPAICTARRWPMSPGAAVSTGFPRSQPRSRRRTSASSDCARSIRRNARRWKTAPSTATTCARSTNMESPARWAPSLTGSQPQAARCMSRWTWISSTRRRPRGVVTTVPGGATVREAHLVMEMLHDTGLMTSLDLVELNPFLDDRGRTAQLMVDLAASALGRRVFDRPTRAYG